MHNLARPTKAARNDSGQRNEAVQMKCLGPGRVKDAVGRRHWKGIAGIDSDLIRCLVHLDDGLRFVGIDRNWNARLTTGGTVVLLGGSSGLVISIRAAAVAAGRGRYFGRRAVGNVAVGSKQAAVSADQHYCRGDAKQLANQENRTSDLHSTSTLGSDSSIGQRRYGIRTPHDAIAATHGLSATSDDSTNCKLSKGRDPVGGSSDTNVARQTLILDHHLELRLG
jgi:hypothetical protein